LDKIRTALTDSATTVTAPVNFETLTARAELTGKLDLLGEFDIDNWKVRLGAGHENLWAIVERRSGGGIAWRLAHLPGGLSQSPTVRKLKDGLRVAASSEAGDHRVELKSAPSELKLLRSLHEFIPTHDIWPTAAGRDIYPMDEHLDPLGAVGTVEAAQRGPNSGICLFRLTSPAVGTALYFQNLTALNNFCELTGTDPTGTVGGAWPELGYRSPTAGKPSDGQHALPKDRPVVMSDAMLVLHDDHCADEQNGAKRFIQMLGSAYRQLELPGVEFRDWMRRSEMTLRDLSSSRKARIHHYGKLYMHAYTDTEYPDVMVQMTLISSLHDWAAWTNKPLKVERDLAAGLTKFHDRKLGTMKRYLPNVGKDKDAKAVDSWYLYHPMVGLGRLALDGDRRASRLFKASLDYAIKAARHFNYHWPIQFKVDDFAVIVEARNDDGLGQTDVGGIYAFVMTQAFQLTGEQRFLKEARAAIDGAKGMRFELEYQANLTAWGATACMRLWRITGDDSYLRQSYVYLASFFHNTQIWQSKLGAAKNYNNFLGATCLHDAPYMAIYECFDSYAAFQGYLQDGGPDLDQTARMLVSEYCKYALSRAWHYYPDTLPAEILAQEQRNGHIDRNLSFPLEDLYSDGQAPGQVGQEIYGAGAAFVFASRSFHNIDTAPFRMFCDHFVTASEGLSDHSITFQLAGGDACEAHLSLIPNKGKTVEGVKLSTPDGDRIRGVERDAGRVEYVVPANGRLILTW
jgi:hypothetical protein